MKNHSKCSEPIEGGPLLLPGGHCGQGAGPLVVCLDEGEGIEDLAPFLHVVHVLEGDLLGGVQEVQVHHHGLHGSVTTQLHCGVN